MECPNCGWIDDGSDCTGVSTNPGLVVYINTTSTSVASNGYERYYRSSLPDAIDDSIAAIKDLGRQFAASRLWVQSSWTYPRQPVLRHRRDQYIARVTRSLRAMPSRLQRDRTKRRFERQRIWKAAGL